MSRAPAERILAITMEARGRDGVTVGCVCGFRARAADETALRRQLRAHVDRVHPEFAFTDEQLRDWVRSERKEARR